MKRIFKTGKAFRSSSHKSQILFLQSDNRSKILFSRRSMGCFGMILFLSFINAININAQGTDTLSLSLEEALNNAVSENSEMLISKLEVQRAESQRKAVNGRYYPQISIDGQIRKAQRNRKSRV